jgi:hypothetical protein
MPFLSNPSVGQIQPLPASYPRPGQVVLGGNIDLFAKRF